MMRAHEIAAKAAELVGGDRAKTHGSKLENHENIATLWRGYLRNKARAGGDAADVSALDVANMMELLKVARRQAGAHNADDYIDGAGYASVAGEIAEHMAVAEAATKASGESFSAVAADVAAKLDAARVRDAARVDDGADAPGEGLVEPRDWCVRCGGDWWAINPASPDSFGGGATKDPARVWRMTRQQAKAIAPDGHQVLIAEPAPPRPTAAHRRCPPPRLDVPRAFCYE